MSFLWSWYQKQQCMASGRDNGEKNTCKSLLSASGARGSNNAEPLPGGWGQGLCVLPPGADTCRGNDGMRPYPTKMMMGFFMENCQHDKISMLQQKIWNLNKFLPKSKPSIECKINAKYTLCISPTHRSAPPETWYFGVVRGGGAGQNTT